MCEERRGTSEQIRRYVALPAPALPQMTGLDLEWARRRSLDRRQCAKAAGGGFERCKTVIGCVQGSVSGTIVLQDGQRGIVTTRGLEIKRAGLSLGRACR